MAEDESLDQAIEAFRETEARLAALAEEAESMAAAAGRITDAEGALQEASAAIAETAEGHTDLIRRLDGLAGDLGEATEVLRRADPAKLLEAIDRLTADFERQKDRLNELAGEMKARIEDVGRSIDVSVADSVEETLKAVDGLGAGIAESLGSAADDAQLRHDSICAQLGDSSDAILAGISGAVEILSSKLSESEERTSIGIDTLRRRFWLPTLAGLALGAIAVILLIVVLVIG